MQFDEHNTRKRNICVTYSDFSFGASRPFPSEISFIRLPADKAEELRMSDLYLGQGGHMSK